MLLFFFIPLSENLKNNKTNERRKSIKSRWSKTRDLRRRGGNREKLVFTVCMAMNIEALLTTLPMSVMADSRLFGGHGGAKVVESVSYDCE